MINHLFVHVSNSNLHKFPTLAWIQLIFAFTPIPFILMFVPTMKETDDILAENCKIEKDEAK